MNNGFCISKNALKDLWLEKQKKRLFECIKEFNGKLSLQEMHDQMKSDDGVFNELITKSNSKFSSKTENVEVVAAFDLSDLYFPDSTDTEICFEMKSSFSYKKGEALSYDDIVNNIESKTHLDCLIRKDGKKFNFQIKRYPQSYLLYTTEAVNEYIKKIIEGYGDMKDTILIILLQPNGDKTDNLNLKNVHEYLLSISKQISFNEVNFIFNEMNQRIKWLQVFPEYEVSEKVIELFSDKYKDIQTKWKEVEKGLNV